MIADLTEVVGHGALFVFSCGVCRRARQESPLATGLVSHALHAIGGRRDGGDGWPAVHRPPEPGADDLPRGCRLFPGRHRPRRPSIGWRTATTPSRCWRWPDALRPGGRPAPAGGAATAATSGTSMPAMPGWTCPVRRERRCRSRGWSAMLNWGALSASPRRRCSGSIAVTARVQSSSDESHSTVGILCQLAMVNPAWRSCSP